MKVLRVSEVAARLGDAGVSTVWKMAQTDVSFPKPMKVSPKITGWLENEIDAFILKKAAERPEKLTKAATPITAKGA
jgi:prophage regulatory protein